MDTKIIEVETLVEHPMEGVLDIYPGSTVHQAMERQTSDISETTTEAYDNKDTEIETQFQEVYDAAMDAYDSQMNTSESVEGRYAARNGEVAVQFLNAALNAAKEKSNVKQHKDKLSIARGKLTGAGTTNNNLIVADRNDILKALASSTAAPTIQLP